MGLVAEDLNPKDHIPAKYGIIGVLVTAVFFQIVNQVTQKVGPPASLDKADVWKWRNLFISWIHAVIVGTWDLSCFILYPELMDDLIAYKNTYIYAMIAFSTGYFLHDFIDLAANGKFFSSWEIIAHHIAVAGMFFYNLLTSLCIGYNVIALLCEVNTIFLHSRKLLQMVQYSFSHWLYRSASYMNLFTFVCCRFLALVWIVWGMFIYTNRVPVMYFVAISLSMFVMWGINIILFWRLLRNDLLRRWFSGSSSSSKKKGLQPQELGSGFNSTDSLSAQQNNHAYVNASNNNKVMNGTKSKASKRGKRFCTSIS